MPDLTEATYTLIHALRGLDAKCERDGKSTVVVYLDLDDYSRAYHSMAKSLVGTYEPHRREPNEFQVNGIVIRCRGPRR